MSPFPARHRQTPPTHTRRPTTPVGDEQVIVLPEADPPEEGVAGPERGGAAGETGAGPERGGAAGGTGAGAHDLAPFVAAFERWAQDELRPELVAVGGIGPMSLGAVLARLADADLPASSALRRGLGLSGRSVGVLAADLRHARESARGPRCRSYRAALYYLRGLEQLAEEPARPDRSERSPR